MTGKAQKTAVSKDTGAKSETQASVQPSKVEAASVGVQSPVNAATHPYRPTFIKRVQEVFAGLTPEGNSPADFAGEAWKEICLAVTSAAPSMADSAAYSDFAKGWVNMTSPLFVKAISEFETVIATFNQASSSQFATAKSFGFWSKPSGRKLAESCTDLTLESTRAGAIFDDFPSLEGGSWDPELWGAMSKGYADAVAKEVLSTDKTIRVCIGPNRSGGNIWDSIESKSFGGTATMKARFEEAITYYSAFTASKDSADVDVSYNEGGITGAGYAGKIEKTAVDKATAHNTAHV